MAKPAAFVYMEPYYYGQSADIFVEASTQIAHVLGIPVGGDNDSGASFVAYPSDEGDATKVQDRYKPRAEAACQKHQEMIAKLREARLSKKPA